MDLPAASKPQFELIASPNPIAIGAGTSNIATVTATVSIAARGGFDSPVTLTAANGTYITGSFSPGTIYGAGSSTLTISVAGPFVHLSSHRYHRDQW